MADFDDTAAAARVAGYSWDEINAHKDQATDAALAQGHDQADVDAHLGYQSPAGLKETLAGDAQLKVDGADHPVVQATDGAVAAEPPGQDKPAFGDISPDARSAYAAGLKDGSVRAPDDFAQHYMDAATDALPWSSDYQGLAPEHSAQAAHDLASGLPHPEQFTDTAIALAHQAGVGVDPATVSTVRQNLLDRYAQDGKTPDQILADVNAPQPPVYGASGNRINPLLDGLTRAPTPDPPQTVNAVLTNIWDAVEKPFEQYKELGNYGLGAIPLAALALPHVVNDFFSAGIEGAQAGGAEALRAAGWSKADADGLARDAVGAIMTGAMALDPALGGVGKSIEMLPSLSNTITHIKTGVDPVVAQVMAETAPDLFTHEALQSAINALPPEQVAGELSARSFMEHMRDIFHNEDGALVWIPGNGYIADPFRQGASSAAERSAKGVPEGAEQASLDLSTPQPAEARAQEAFDREMAARREAGVGGETSLERPQQPAEARAQEAFDREMAARREAGVGGATELDRPLQPQDIRDAQARIRAEGYVAEHGAGMAAVREVPLDLTRPVQPADIVDAAARARAEASVAEKGAGVVSKEQEALISERPVQPADIRDAEARARAEAIVEAKGAGVEPKAETGDLGMERPQQPRDIAEAEARARAEEQVARTGAGVKDAVEHSLFSGFRTPAEFVDAVRAAARSGRVEAMDAVARLPGMSDREQAAGWAQLSKFIKDLNNNHLDEYNEQLANKFGGTPGVLKQVMDYLQNRKAEMPLPADHPMASTLAAMRAAQKLLRDEIEARGGANSFMMTHMRQLYRDPASFEKAMGITADSAPRRSLPDYHEAIANGMAPRALSPLEGLMHMQAGMREWITQQRVMEQGIKTGHVYSAYRPTSRNDTELRGSVFRPDPRTQEGGLDPALAAQSTAPGMKMFAVNDWAKIYNRYYSRGFYGWGDGTATLYQKLQFAANASVGMKLSLSAYHAMNIVQETWTAGMGRVIGDLGHGQVVNAFKDAVGYGLVLPKILQGKRDLNIYLRNGKAKNVTAAEEQMVDLLTEAGARFGGRPEYSKIDNLSNIWKVFSDRNAFMRERKNEWDRIINGEAGEGTVKRMALMLPRVVEYFAKELGKTIAEPMLTPLFDHAIPSIKIAVAHDEMAAWLSGKGAKATPEAQRMQMQGILRSMDDRFGEMNQDRMYWNREFKQILNLATVSVGWEYGTLRSFGGAAKDIGTLNWDSTRARWFLGFHLVNYMMNSIYQRLHTGTFPWSDNAPTHWYTGALGGWSGGMIKGMPELKMLPSYAKDEMQLAIHMMQIRNWAEVPSALTNYGVQKMNNLAQLFVGIASGYKRDMFGWQQITDLDPKATRSWGLPPGWAKFIGELYAPIAMSAEKPPVGGIKPTWPETGPFGVGVRNVPTALSDPARVAKAQHRADLYTERDQLKQQIAHLKNLQDTATDVAELQATLKEINNDLKTPGSSGGGGYGASAGGGGGGGAGGGGLTYGGSQVVQRGVAPRGDNGIVQEGSAPAANSSQPRAYSGSQVVQRGVAPGSRSALTGGQRASRAYYARRYYRGA